MLLSSIICNLVWKYIISKILEIVFVSGYMLPCFDTTIERQPIGVLCIFDSQ